MGIWGMNEGPTAVAGELLELIDELLGFPADMEHDEVRLELPSLLLKPTTVGDQELEGERLLAFVATPFSAVDLSLTVGPAPSLAHPVIRRRAGGERGHELTVSDITLDCPTARQFVRHLLDAYFPASLSITTR